MADPSPPRSDLQQLVDEIASIRLAVDGLRAPTGTQQYNAVRALQAAVAALQEQQTLLAQQQAQLTAQQEVIVDLVDGLDQRVTDFIENNIDDIVAQVVTDKLGAADITIGRTGGTVRIPSIITTDLTSASGRVVTWTAGDGRIGHT
ncbi:hypothetical protein [uncultured Microbacterium sp.]|uniref:hypothetical protein n=1 Tax=uncultured Microbacterium sp. TaxID=191216 RepID=UPI002600266B|nr:hypothetical protein [uncultured Microbacterium sp.]